MRLRSIAVPAAAFAFAACATTSSTPTSDGVSHAGGLDIAGMDRSVKPGDDFYAYANQGWMKTTEIPADRSRFGPGEALSEQVGLRNRALLEAAAADGGAPDTAGQRVGDYYASFMDEGTIESLGLAPVKPQLAAIAAIANRTDLARYLGGTLRADVDPMNNSIFYTDHVFGLWVAQDLVDTTHYVPYLMQGGLGMLERDYYLSDSADMAAIRTKYQAHLATVLKLAGLPDPEARAQRIYQLEHDIALTHATRIDSEDVHKANNPWKREEFATKAPGLDWATYFAAAGLAKAPRFIVWQPSAFTGIAALAGQVPLETWKEYLSLRAIEHHARMLPKAFVDERFAFYGKVLSGTPVLRERWKRGVDATNDVLGDAVGQLYVARHFPPEAKAKAQAMVANIVAAFGHRVEALEWMAPATKAQAQAKLATLYVGIGYPDKWRDDAGLRIVRGDAWGNEERAEQFDYQLHLKRIGQVVDAKEWCMEPQVVNAVNMPLQNALNFPAAILQPPYFDPEASDAVNYGAMGAIIGHEISHSFDDQGSQFDAHGRLANWWTPDDLAHFQAAAAKLVAQYSAYRPFPDLAINGQQVLSENIADVAGLSAAFDAFRAAAPQAPVVEGFSGEQQFFIGFAQSWRQKSREPALRAQMATDGHAPDAFRALTVRNLDGWYPAFDVQPGQKLYLAPADRVHVW